MSQFFVYFEFCSVLYAYLFVEYGRYSYIEQDTAMEIYIDLC